MFVATIAPATKPIAPAINKNASGLSCAQSANFCKYGRTASRTGSNAAPIDSLVSPIEFFIIANLPAAVSAFAATAPPNVPPNTAITSSRVAPSLIMVAISGDNVRNALKLPWYARANASATVALSAPVAVLMSMTRFMSFMATPTSLVPRTSASNALR